MRVKFAKKIEKIRKNKFKEEAKILKLKYYIIRTNKNCFFSTIRDNFKIDGVSETVKHKIMLLYSFKQSKLRKKNINHVLFAVGEIVKLLIDEETLLRS